MGNKRIYEVAKDYGKPVNEVIDLLKKNNIEKTNFSAADDKAMSVIRKAYDKKTEPPKPAKTEKRDVSKPAAPARPQDTAKRNDNNMNRNNGQRNMQQNQQQNQRNNNNAQQGRNENRQGGRNEGRPQQNRGGQQGNRQGGRNEGRPQNRNGQQGGQGNRQGNRNGQQRQGGIFVGPKSQQGPSVHGESRAQVSGGRSEGRSSGRSEGGRDNRQGGRNAGKSRKDNKLQIKGSYATRESRPNRSAGHQMPINRGGKKPAPKQQQAPVEIVRPTYVEIGESINVQEFSKLIKREVNEVIKALFMLGVMVTINQDIDFDTAQLIGDNFGVEVGQKAPEEDPTEIPEVDDPPEKRVPRPPVITVMGHVDHGKTSLLDAIRKTNVTSREAGGITQHIGAYKVNYQGKQIVFLDTPGHEAFTAMRARGAQATDIAILVVAADDSVMPQTIEAINHAKAANVPIIVAINKMDKPEADPERVKTDLTKYGIVCEDWGGDTIMCPVSAKTGEGVDELLEMILLQADTMELRANPNRLGRGVIIEAKLDKARGPLATVLMQNGTLHVGDNIIAGLASGRVRALINDRGEKVKEAGPSTPVEIMGFDEVPSAGDEMQAVGDDRLSRQVAEERKAKVKASREATMAKVSLENMFSNMESGKQTTLNLIIKADVQGSVEAVKQAMEKLSSDEVKVHVLHSAAGAITKDDVNLASAFNAIIIGFNIRPDASAREAAEREKVDVRLYTVIYKAIEDMELAMKGLLAPEYREVLLGHAEVRNVFKITGAGVIAGCYVTDGKVQRNAQVRLLRDNVVVFEGKLSSLKHYKEDVKEMAAGFECGMSLEGHNDIKEGDVVECFIMEEIPR